MTIRRLLLVSCSLFLAACGGVAIFQSSGGNLANPLTVAVDSTNARAYVVNSNNKFLYTDGSLHVVNIAAPTAPTRMNSVVLDSYSGEAVLDAVNRIVYLPNRLSENVDDTSDHVLRIDVNEAAGTFLGTTALDASGNPFGGVIVAGQNRLYVAAREGFLNFYDITSAAPTAQNVDLKRTLSDGSTLSTADVTSVVVIGAQAILSRASGGLLVVNLDELTGGSNPVDYYISDLASPRGLATDGTLLYVVNVETDNDGNNTNSLLILNLATLTADTGNTMTAVRDKDDAGLLVATVALGTDPQQVVLGATEGFVSNLGDDTITIFTIASQAKVTDITVGDEPFGMALYSPGGVDTHLLVCNIQSNTVSIVDVGSRAVAGTYQ